MGGGRKGGGGKHKGKGQRKNQKKQQHEKPQHEHEQEAAAANGHIDPVVAADVATAAIDNALGHLSLEEQKVPAPVHVDPMAELLREEEQELLKKKHRKKKNKKPAAPPKKAGETKKQYEARLRHEEGGGEEFVAHPPVGARLLMEDPSAFEEEEPEAKSEATNEDYSDTQNERAREYRKGGYHPVLPNELYNDRYRVVRKLGWGYFSTVWLVWDYADEKFQAMKVQKSADHYREAAFDEIKLLSQIMAADPQGEMCCARMTDSFEHKGPHGRHICMLFDLLGENLLSLIERYENRGIPLPIVKSLARETLIGLHHLHSVNIIHTDIKPENVLLASPKHKIHHLMRGYKPPPHHKRVSLMERDVKMMTKSQRRRYYQKLRKEEERKEGGGGKEIADDPKLENPPLDAEENKSIDGGDDHANKDKETEEEEAAKEKENIRNEEEDDDASETDPEWEVERFHHCCLADFGNSCWTDLQFTDEVQTRQYRAPEVLLGDPYSTPIDLWSAACMFFELLTGEFLFDPQSREDYPRDEDHLALVSELLGPLPEHMRIGKGKYRAQFYNSRGEFRHIGELRFWSLRDVLHEKYHYSRKKATEIANFLLPMLAVDPNERATALDMLTEFEDWFEVQEDDYSPLCYTSPEQKKDHHHHDDEEVEEGEDDEDYEDFEPEEIQESTIDEDFSGSEEISDDGSGSYADSELEGSKENLSPERVGGMKRKKKKHRSHRPSRHSDHSQHQDEMAVWFHTHPILSQESLAKRGLTIEDVKAVLAEQELSDPEKDAEARVVVQALIEADEA